MNTWKEMAIAYSTTCERIRVSRLCRVDLGQKAFQQMQRTGMETDYIQWDEEIPTGTVDIRLDESRKPVNTATPWALLVAGQKGVNQLVSPEETQAIMASGKPDRGLTTGSRSTAFDRLLSTFS